MHPTHSLDAVVDSLRASELLECRCRPDLNADRAPTEAVVATKCQDPACTGLFRVVVHPRHGLGGPARANSALGASLVVLRPWQHAARNNARATSNAQQQQPAASTSQQQRRRAAESATTGSAATETTGSAATADWSAECSAEHKRKCMLARRVGSLVRGDRSQGPGRAVAAPPPIEGVGDNSRFFALLGSAPQELNTKCCPA
jgi:hypothetical protein